MNSRLQEGWFLRLGTVICNESNNTETDMSQGKLYVDLSYVPVVPADFIYVNINEDYTILDNLAFDTRPANAF
jgi:phage tail sheath protein FI